jgi:hypothetical protein
VEHIARCMYDKNKLEKVTLELIALLHESSKFNKGAIATDNAVIVSKSGLYGHTDYDIL